MYRVTRHQVTEYFVAADDEGEAIRDAATAAHDGFDGPGTETIRRHEEWTVGEK
jgi:hypothetical protein